ncbi:uncharacterized protein LOC111622086 [Centruroides sculpturatus]|uniref:uncharacterized protein LOC111622086 n=1 Tax=Centruroides sculpturatus TaxID=218467 RepID=UPI000C6DBD8D|nr:uncharacterized protein LOC111622086 [Centruroides sculpturatus]
MEIFTDGSKVENQVGASYLVMQNEKEIYHDKFRLDDRCTVHQAELFAILQSVRWIISTRLTGSIIIVNTDSKAAICYLQQFNNRNIMALEIKNLINKHELNIKIRWVKAHVGIMGNEKADALAKEATLQSEIAYNKIPLSYIKEMLRQESIQ